MILPQAPGGVVDALVTQEVLSCAPAQHTHRFTERSHAPTEPELTERQTRSRASSSNHRHVLELPDRIRTCRQVSWNQS